MEFDEVTHVSLLCGFDDGTIGAHMGIEYEGALWLVTAWLIDTATGSAVPERMIRIGQLPLPAQVALADERFDYANVLLPKSVILGRTEDTPGYEVRSLPERPRVHRNRLKKLPL